jgi:hypothetical protein
MEPTFTLTLGKADLDLVFEALGELPAKKSYLLLRKLETELQPPRPQEVSKTCQECQSRETGSSPSPTPVGSNGEKLPA